MKIISRQKDYYDYVGKIYGEDTKLVYERDKVPSGKYLLKTRDYETFKAPQLVNHQFIQRLYVLGYVYYILWTSDYNFKARLLTEADAELFDTRFFRNSVHEYKLDGQPACNVLVDLSKELKAPIFLFDVGYFDREGALIVIKGGDYQFNLNLGSYGFANIKSAEAMYQELSCFFGSLISSEPPVEISDKDRIAAHGFDLKKSFRHRK